MYRPLVFLLALAVFTLGRVEHKLELVGERFKDPSELASFIVFEATILVDLETHTRVSEVIHTHGQLNKSGEKILVIKTERIN